MFDMTLGHFVDTILAVAIGIAVAYIVLTPLHCDIMHGWGAAYSQVYQ